MHLHLVPGMGQPRTPRPRGELDVLLERTAAMKSVATAASPAP
ncbi:hypothetical protein [Archangium sp.]|nr:hypothetical protein [Archangium sp.]HYO56095.1 hypothetical protein [Archangium sp.]